MDTAIACLWDKEDGTYKLWRETYRVRADSDARTRPHVDATKLLVLTVMEDAAARNLTLETDGSTPGSATFYAMFGPGIFRRTTRLQCERQTVWASINKNYPSMFRKLNFAHPSSEYRETN
jgi:hypothetical protein